MIENLLGYFGLIIFGIPLFLYGGIAYNFYIDHQQEKRISNMQKETRERAEESRRMRVDDRLHALEAEVRKMRMAGKGEAT